MGWWSVGVVLLGDFFHTECCRSNNINFDKALKHAVIQKTMTRGVEEAKKGGDMVDFINSLRESHSKYLKWQIMAEGIGGSD